MNDYHKGINLSDVLEAQGLSPKQVISVCPGSMSLHQKFGLYPEGNSVRTSTKGQKQGGRTGDG